MAIVLVNPGGNIPNGNSNAEGETIEFALAPEPGAGHMDGVVLLYSSLPGNTERHPAADVILGNFIGTDVVGIAAFSGDWLL